MLRANAKTHPETLYARMHNSVSLIARIENGGETRWVEAEVQLPEKLSLAADTQLRKGRMRLGIVEKDETLEKSVRIYGNQYTDAQLYNCKLIVFTYDKDGTIDKRIDVSFTVKCEEQKPPVI